MSHNSKTWALAERSRNVSKGQAKMFLTRSAGEEQRLAKLTQQLDKEKAARESQLSYAQKLLMKRYGGGKIQDGRLASASEWRSPARDRSQTCDPTFITRAYGYNGEQVCPEITGRARAASGSSCDLDSNSTGITRGLTDIPRVRSQGNVSNFKGRESPMSARRKISFSVGDLLRARTNCSGSDGEIHKDSIGNQTGQSKVDDWEERRPRAVSEVLPPISLPPIFKLDENSKMAGKSNSVPGGLAKGSRKTSVARKTSKVVESNQAHAGTRLAPKDSITDEKTMHIELRECRYLRTRNLED